MNGWLAQNLDYLTFLVLVTVLWGGLVWYLHRTGRLPAAPKAIWVLLVALLGGGWLLVDRAGHDAQDDLRRQVELLMPYYVHEFQEIGHARLPDRPAPDNPLYLQLIEAEKSWLKLNPIIGDIYTFRRRADGAVFFLVDSETDYDHDGRFTGTREERTVPGEVYNGLTPALEQAFLGRQIFDEVVVTDRWGTWVSAFAPLRDSEGRVEAVCGVDFDAAQWLGKRAAARQAWLYALGGLVLALGAGAVTITLLRHDLAQRRKNERQLREQGELRRMLFDQAPGGVVLCGLDARLIEVNEAFCQMLGYSREELLRMAVPQFTHPDFREDTLTATQQVAIGEPGHKLLEKRYIRKDGTFLDAIVSVGLIRDEGGAPLYMVGQIADITGRRRTESESQFRQKQLTTILTHAPLLLFTLDAQGVFTLSEGAGLTAIGNKPGEAVGHSIYDRYATRPDILADIRRALGGETLMSVREINGAIFEARYTPLHTPDGAISGVIGIAIDVTAREKAERARKKMEHQLLDMQKLESLGILAGGVAHDFNNLLTAIMGHTSLARLALGEVAPARTNLDQIEQASRTAAGLCQQLLAYSGRGRIDTSEVDLGSLIGDMTELLRLSAGSRVKLKFELLPHLAPISADAGQLRQAILNLVLNATEAIGQREGTIEIRTRMLTVDALWLTEARIGQDIRPGEYVCLEITDNGPGLSAETQARVFDPFFATKTRERGLGLAATLGIMRSHQGALHLWSELGRGTKFSLIFPPHSPPPVNNEQPAADRNWKGSGSVLIVDDEESVRATAAQMIAYFGFQVRQASSGQLALDIVRQSPAAFDLVLLDLTMPGMDGFTTFGAIRQLRPDQRIVIFSGYSEQDARQRFVGQNLSGFLQKPFSADTLREVLRLACLPSPTLPTS